MPILFFLWDPLVQDTIIDKKKLDSPASTLKWNKNGKLAVGHNGNIVFFDLH